MAAEPMTSSKIGDRIEQRVGGDGVEVVQSYRWETGPKLDKTHMTLTAEDGAVFSITVERLFFR